MSVRCNSCYGDAGREPGWTRAVLCYWVCEDCWEKLKNVGPKEEMVTDEDFDNARQMVRDAIEQLPNIDAIRVSKIIEHGPFNPRHNPFMPIWEEEVKMIWEEFDARHK